MNEEKLTEQEKAELIQKEKEERRSDNFLYCHFNIYIHTMWGFDYYRLKGVSMVDEYVSRQAADVVI